MSGNCVLEVQTNRERHDILQEYRKKSSFYYIQFDRKKSEYLGRKLKLTIGQKHNKTGFICVGNTSDREVTAIYFFIYTSFYWQKSTQNNTTHRQHICQSALREGPSLSDCN